MKDDPGLQGVASWYSTALLLLLPIPLWLAGFLSSPLLVASSAFILIILFTNFFHLREGFIGPRNFLSVLRGWIGDARAEISWKLIPYEEAETLVPGYLAWPGANIPRSLALIIALFSVFTLVSFYILASMASLSALNALGVGEVPMLGSLVLLAALLILSVGFDRYIKETVPKIALAFYQHLSLGGTFFKLASTHMIILILLSPAVIALWSDKVTILGWLKDIYTLSLFGSFIDFALIMGVRYGLLGKLGGICAGLAGILLFNEMIPLMALFIFIEAALSFGRAGGAATGAMESHIHLAISALVAVALLLGSDLLAAAAFILIPSHMIASMADIARKRPDVLMC